MISPCRAARSMPPSDAPAWAITGWPCGPARNIEWTANLEEGVVVIDRHGARVIPEAIGRNLTLPPGIPARPELLCHIEKFDRTGIALVARRKAPHCRSWLQRWD